MDKARIDTIKKLEESRGAIDLIARHIDSSKYVSSARMEEDITDALITSVRMGRAKNPDYKNYGIKDSTIYRWAVILDTFHDWEGEVERVLTFTDLNRLAQMEVGRSARECLNLFDFEWKIPVEVPEKRQYKKQGATPEETPKDKLLKTLTTFSTALKRFDTKLDNIIEELAKEDK